jgi:cofilin
MSGHATIHDDCVTAFNKISKRPQKIPYAIFKLDAEFKNIVLEKEGEKNATHDDFMAAFDHDEPRFAIYDFKWDRDDGRKGTCIFFVLYVPESVSEVAMKFSYANNKDAIKAKCQPLNKDMNINDKQDFSFENFKDEAE